MKSLVEEVKLWREKVRNQEQRYQQEDDISEKE
jgi:hypothetical protein